MFTATAPALDIRPDTRSKALFSPTTLFLIDTKPIRDASSTTQSACAGSTAKIVVAKTAVAISNFFIGYIPLKNGM